MFTDSDSDLIPSETIIDPLAQHCELLEQALSPVPIRPDIDLNLIHFQQGLPDLTRRVPKGTSNAINHLAASYRELTLVPRERD